MLTINEACRVLRLGRTKVYELIALGELVAIKIDRATRITDENLQNFISSRPRLKSKPVLTGAQPPQVKPHPLVRDCTNAVTLEEPKSVTTGGEK